MGTHFLICSPCWPSPHRHKNPITLPSNRQQLNLPKVYIYNTTVDLKSFICGSLMRGKHEVCTDWGEMGLGVEINSTTCSYATSQWGLKEIIEYRIRKSGMWTTDPRQAQIFFIPVYVKFLDMLREDWSSSDEIVGEILSSIFQNLDKEVPGAFKECDGCNHFMVTTEKDDRWQSTTKNTIQVAFDGEDFIPEGKFITDVSSPHPSYFHYHSSSSSSSSSSTSSTSSGCDLSTTLEKPILSREYKYVLILGNIKGRRHEKIRSTLMEICRSTPSCLLLAPNSSNSVSMYTQGQFCLQPPGDNPQRKGVFDCLHSGAIPVVYHPLTLGRYINHIPEPLDISFYISPDEAAQTIQILDQVSNKELVQKQQAIIALRSYTHYANDILPSIPDAVDIVMQALGNVSHHNKLVHSSN
eukprot:TRINITY_DN3420_c0_g1_i4.p1 TRINITY_DN3420_c0_g1~~TRINITY_DN3420_c0_g1_i4.p1  ORF type:complete len:463 (-),score=45.24 TRINITY_DN3420_c0_g1_i4:169-1404(-)